MAQIVELDESYLYDGHGWLAGRDANGEVQRQARIERRPYDTCVELFPPRKRGEYIAPVPVRVLFLEDYPKALQIAKRWCTEEV
jgi:hypothetical protein